MDKYAVMLMLYAKDRFVYVSPLYDIVGRKRNLDSSEDIQYITHISVVS